MTIADFVTGVFPPRLFPSERLLSRAEIQGRQGNIEYRHVNIVDWEGSGRSALSDNRYSPNSSKRHIPSRQGMSNAELISWSFFNILRQCSVWEQNLWIGTAAHGNSKQKNADSRFFR